LSENLKGKYPGICDRIILKYISKEIWCGCVDWTGRRLGETQSRSGHGGVKKNPCR
jgi:hypothetical protein